jgi:hypothetical protein
MEDIQVVTRPARFRPYRAEREGSPGTHENRLIRRVKLTKATALIDAHGWSGFEGCHVCPDEWNMDFGGPFFSPGHNNSEASIANLTLRVTMQNVERYPIRATGYLYDVDDAFLGTLDLRYFGPDMPRALKFDVSQHRFPESTRFMIAFQVGGGGSPRVLRPPLITSVGIEILVQARIEFDKRVKQAE